MTATDKPLDFLWFIPSSGDGSYLGSDDLVRPPIRRISAKSPLPRTASAIPVC